MIKPTVRKLVRKSELMKQARLEFEEWKKIQPDLDPDTLDDEAIEDYVQFLAYQHREDWIVIDDTND